MTQFDEKTLKNLTELCCINLNADEQKAILEHIKKILEYMNLLHEVDTQDIEPCHHVVDYGANAWREDEVGNILSREAFLANAPDHVGGMIRVPPVLKQNP